ncbi:hypothetical protein QMK38_01845 [Lysinibacillus fusiformis]|nr:hypothetical protein [Lysinibacillus fusiformis]
MISIKEYISPIELIELLKPKIKKELHQTDLKNRDDLEHEIILKILEGLKTKKFQHVPTFFELLEKEQQQE